jgi:hypothetical protein
MSDYSKGEEGAGEDDAVLVDASQESPEQESTTAQNQLDHSAGTTGQGIDDVSRPANGVSSSSNRMQEPEHSNSSDRADEKSTASRPAEHTENSHGTLSSVEYEPHSSTVPQPEVQLNETTSTGTGSQEQTAKSHDSISKAYEHSIAGDYSAPTDSLLTPVFPDNGNVVDDEATESMAAAQADQISSTNTVPERGINPEDNSTSTMQDPWLQDAGNQTGGDDSVRLLDSRMCIYL